MARPRPQTPSTPPPLARPLPAPHHHPLRLGPRPLLLHMTAALSVWPSLPIAWASWKNASPNLKAASPPAATAELDAAFQQALAAEGIKRSRAFFQGVRAYRAHPARRAVAPAPILLTEGSTTLRDYGATDQAPIVLVVPSLINRLDILDLLPQQSFLRSLSAQGWRPLAVDWGAPGDDEAGYGLDAYIGRLRRLFDHTLKLAGGQPIHVVGYCMGGLLCLALASLRRESIRSLTLMAVPWDFHQGESVIFRALAQQLEPLIAACGQLPVEALQSLFAAFQPLHTLQKFAAFAALDPASDAARRFVLLEDWLNDGVPLTANLARDCLDSWYAGNRPARGGWLTHGQRVDPARLTMPTMLIIPGGDRIVPPASARALAALMPHALVAEPLTGHIGLMASRIAPAQIWAPWFAWLGRQV